MAVLVALVAGSVVLTVTSIFVAGYIVIRAVIRGPGSKARSYRGFI